MLEWLVGGGLLLAFLLYRGPEFGEAHKARLKRRERDKWRRLEIS